MVESNGIFITTETRLAIYLIQQGFKLNQIQYEHKQNGNYRAMFVFNAHDYEVKPSVETYNNRQAIINIDDYEDIRNNLLDRIKRRLP